MLGALRAAPRAATSRGLICAFYTTGLADGLHTAVGNAPLIYLKTQSELTGAVVLGRAWVQNPGSSANDCGDVGIIQDVEIEGL